MTTKSTPIADRTIGTTAAGKLFGRSARWVQYLATNGFLPGSGRTGWRLGDLRTAVIAHYEAELQKGEKKTAATSASAARTRLIEQQIAKNAGELIPLDEANGAIMDLAGIVDAALVSLPARLGGDAHERGRVRRIVDDIRSEIVRGVERACGDAPPGGGADRAAPADEPERVGGAA